MKYIINFLAMLLLSTTLSADGCWTPQELSNYAMETLDDKTIFSFKDAITCKPIDGVEIKFLGQKFTTTVNGTLMLPVPPDEIDGNFPISINAEGYIPVMQQLPVSFGTYWQNMFLLTKALPLNSARFILAWGEKPKDLDLHLISDDFHISFRKTKEITNRVKLDRDARKGYGPETITLDNLNKNKTYRVVVNNYSKESTMNQKVKLSTYINNSFNKTVFLKNVSANCVEIATIKNNKIIYNTKTLSDSECR